MLPDVSFEGRKKKGVEGEVLVHTREQAPVQHDEKSKKSPPWRGQGGGPECHVLSFSERIRNRKMQFIAVTVTVTPRGLSCADDIEEKRHDHLCVLSPILRLPPTSLPESLLLTGVVACNAGILQPFHLHLLFPFAESPTTRQRADQEEGRLVVACGGRGHLTPTLSCLFLNSHNKKKNGKERERG